MKYKIIFNISPINKEIFKYLNMGSKTNIYNLFKYKNEFFKEEIKKDLIKCVQKNFRYRRLMRDEEWLLTRKNWIRFYLLFYPNEFFMKIPEYSLKILKNKPKEMYNEIKKIPDIKNRKRSQVLSFIQKWFTSRDFFLIGW